MAPTEVMIVDDHSIMREGLKAVISKQPDFRIVGEAADGRQAVHKAAELRPDVILMDINMPYGGLAATVDIMQRFPETKILMLTVSDKEDDLINAVKAGARGYLLKGMMGDQLVAALKSVAEGGAIFTPAMAAKLVEDFRTMDHKSTAETKLTEREMEVLSLVARGASNKEIATQLDVSEPTVKAHLRNIIGKLHLKNRSQAAVYASQHRLLTPDKPPGKRL
jgi:two-component system nitrate/nitrite response regulator NarL